MSGAGIHPTAIVEPGAEIGAGCRIGPWCLVGPEVVLGEGVVLESHVVVTGRTRVGPRTRIWPFASVGHQPQDLKYRGEPSRLEIGADCMIREGATLNTGTEGGGMVTRLGNGCLLMTGAHVGHDSQIGDRVILANNVGVAGHVEIGDFAVLGGYSAVHQFVRIGAHAMVGGLSGVEKDVIPYGSVIGNRADLGGLNLIGLKRRGFDRETIHALRAAYRMIFFGAGALAERAARAGAEFAAVPAVQEVVAFIQADTSRSFCTPREGGPAPEAAPPDA